MSGVSGCPTTQSHEVGLLSLENTYEKGKSIWRNKYIYSAWEICVSHVKKWGCVVFLKKVHRFVVNTTKVHKEKYLILHVYTLYFFYFLLGTQR